jgi:hypothetical protein
MSKTRRLAVSATSPSVAAKNASDFLIAEYSALRAEMLKRIEIQHQLISLALIATGTFLGLQVPTTIKLAYPILALFLAAAWSQSDMRIRQMGIYIRERIEAKILDNNLGWEHVRASTNIRVFGSRAFIAVRGVIIGTQLLVVIVAMFNTAFPIEDIVFLCIDCLAVISTILLLRPHKVII